MNICAGPYWSRRKCKSDSEGLLGLVQQHQTTVEINQSSLYLSKLKSNLTWHLLNRSHIHIRQHHRLYFFPLWNDCCCIYNRPAINASSGKLVITNGSRSIKSPLWSWRHWQEVYLVDWIDQHILFSFLKSVREEKEGQSISTWRLSHCLLIHLWLAGEDVQSKMLDCS